MSKDDRELIERLRAKRDTGRRTLGGGNVWADGRPSEMWGCEPIFEYVNPDGPAAATRLEALQAQPVGEAIEHALGFVTQGMVIAYENGLRECGYDPVATLRAALTASPPVVSPKWDVCRNCVDGSKAGQTCTVCEGRGHVPFVPTPVSPPVVEREAIARTEYGWLIERDGHGGLRYATPRSWTADHMKALRFARKVDAEEFAASHQDWSTDIRITEHAWD